MGLYRDESGKLLELDDNFAAARGYVPAEATDLGGVIDEAGERYAAEQRGVTGDINAGLTGVASGMTFGLSDVALANSLTPFERERLQADLEAHPNLRMGGEILGATAGAFAAPGSVLGRTPAGYLGNVAAREIEGGLAQGGARGTARALNAMGLEGAAQNAGQYIGHSAIEDKETTAEGLAGSVGTGYAFGAGGGAAVLGVVKGTMAARRLYSRVMDGRKAAQTAESNWKLASQEALDSDIATRQVAETKLDEIRKAKVVAQRERNAARAGVREEQMAAVNAEGRAAVADDGTIIAPEAEGPLPLDEGIAPATGADGGKTHVRGRPEPVPFDPAAAQAFDESMPSMRDQVNEVAGEIKPTYKGAKTGAYKATTQRIQREAPALPSSAADVVNDSVTTVSAKDLEAHGFDSLSVPGKDKVKTARGQQAIKEGQRDPITIAVSPNGRYTIEDGTHRLAAAIEQGKPVKVKWVRGGQGLDEAAPTGYVVKGADDLEGQLAGTKARLDEGVPLKDVKPVKASKGNESNSIEGWLDEKRAFDDAEMDAARASEDIKGAGELRNRRHTALNEIRYKATEDLLGAPAAKMERELQEVLDEYNDAHKALGELSDGIPEPLDGGEIARAVHGEDMPRGRNGTVGASPRARQARQILDDAHEEALLRAKYGADPAEAGKALSEAEELEQLLSQIDDVSDGVPRMVDGSPQEMFADQLANDIRKIWRYEEASAKLADVIGEASHPSSLAKAKAFRDAERDSMRKVSERSTRAIEDMEHFGPVYKTPKERVQYAKGRLNDAQKNLDEMKVQETEARSEFQRAGKKVKEGEAAKRAALSADKAAASAAGKLGAADAGGMLEILDLPGLPKPSDLPIIGPLLGAYLKFRTMKKAMGRFMGRVPATADAQVAARANQTRDRIARAVDRSLGFVEKTGKFASRKMPATAGILAHRIYDDGGEDPGPKASITKQAAARMREVAAYVHTPNAIELDVRRELRGVTDPDLIAAAEKHRRFMMEYILKHMPKVPDQGLLKTLDWEPSPAEAMSLARRMEALNDPPGVFEKLAQERDLVSLEAAETLRDVYPKLFQEALRRATERASEAPGRIPYRTRVQMSVFYRQPFESALEPENFQITQSVYDRKVPQTPVPAMQQTPPVPSVAQPTDLSQEYMPSFDRR